MLAGAGALLLAHVAGCRVSAVEAEHEDDGSQYYWIDQRDPNDPKGHLGHRTRFLRQYFKYIRAGATRVDATSTSKRLGPVAFVNRDGGHVVVVKATAGGPLVIEGLPAGTYVVCYATENDADVDGPR